MQIQVTHSNALHAGYVNLTDKKIWRSEDLTDDLIVDLDSLSCVVGVELLDLDRVPSAADIAAKFHVASAERPMLELALRHLMRWKATNGSLTRRSQVQAQAEPGRTLESC